MDRLRLIVLAVSVGGGCLCSGSLQDTTRDVSIPDALHLGTVFEDEEAAGVVEVRSTGTGAIEVMALAGSGVTVDPVSLPARIGGGGVLAVTVRWKPGGVATLDGFLDVTTDRAPATPKRVRITAAAVAVPECDDGNTCTDDVFDRNRRRCVSTPHDRACDDGSACTGNDRCESGTCRGVALRCDDDDTCTLDFCDPARGCVHPPDPATCDDGDPCTADVCDRNAGCSHPNAPDGTACGLFTCAAANLCVFGTCRVLDVTGASDGFPCFDGDLCTTDDACAAGECVGGPRLRSEPAILGEFPTFGGAGQQAATDGERWVFVAPTHRVFTQRESSGRLRVASVLPGLGYGLPVALGGGRFAFARNGWLSIVDASDPAAVVPVRDVQVVGGSGLNSIENVLPAVGGLYVLARDDVSFPRRGAVFFVPLSESLEPGVPVRLPLGSDVRLFDADGRHVAWVDASSVAWWGRIAADGSVERAVPVLSPTGAPIDVAVERERLAVRGGDFVRVDAVDPEAGQPAPCVDGAPCVVAGTACGGSFPWAGGSFRGCVDDSCGDPALACRTFIADTCPNCDLDCDTPCCSDGAVKLCVTRETGTRGGSLGTYEVPGLRDTTLADGELLTVSSEGLVARTLPNAGEAFEVSVARLVDGLPYERLRRSGTHVFATGPLAMPFERANAADGAATWRRVSGVGHGEVEAIVDGASPTEVVVAGRSSIGAVDLFSLQATRWDVIPTLPLPAVVRGPTRTARLGPPTIPSDPDANESDPDGGPPEEPGEEPPACVGTDVSVLHADASTRTEYRMCGVVYGQRHSVAGDLVWVDPPSGLLGVALERTAPMAYRLSGAGPELEPVHRTDETTGGWWYVDLRGEDTGNGVMAIRLPDELLAPIELAGHSTASSGTTWLARPGPSRGDLPGVSFASEGDSILVSKPGEVALMRAWPEGGTDAGTPELLATVSRSFGGERRLEWMGRGRAWASLQFGHETRPGSEQTFIEQYAYDATAQTLVVDGTLQLSSNVRTLVDAGVVTLVGTPQGLTVVAPACR